MQSTQIVIDTITAVVGFGSIILSVGITWGSFHTKVGRLLKDVEYIMKELVDHGKRISKIEGAMQAKSPLTLTKKGEKYIKESSIKSYMDENFDDIVAKLNIPQNITPYDIEEQTMLKLKRFTFPQDIEEKMKDFSFYNGISMGTITDSAAIYLRGKIIQARNIQA